MGNLAINGGSPVRTGSFGNWPVSGEAELKSVAEVIKSGKWGYPKWEYVPRFEEQFAAYHDTKYGICFNSGTSALTGALWAAGVQKGDEVILPAYTFIATATAVVQLGAIPVFADIEKKNFHLDSLSVKEKITPKTKAVLPVHLGGRMADMDRLRNMCDYYNLKLIEDAAQAWGAEWLSRRAGSVGDAGIFSFQSSKNVTAGEGGIVLTNDKELADYCRSYCNCGRLEDKPRYEHFYIGGNYRLGELNGALLQAQFERFPELTRRRKKNAAVLNEQLALIRGIVPVNETKEITNNPYHIFLMRYKKESFDDIPRSKLIDALQKEGIPAHPGYTTPIYRQPVFIQKAFGAAGEKDSSFPDYNEVNLPETEKASVEEGLWLTQNVLLGSDKDMQDIIDAFTKVRKYSKELK